jgi:hypothetical protein
MSWHYLRGQEEASSEAICWDGEQFVQSSKTTTLGEYCLPDKKMEFCPGSPSGMTCGPSRERLGRDVYRLSQEDFHARMSPSGAAERAWMERNLACGPRWRGLLGRFSPDSCSLRTPNNSLLGDSNEYCGSLPPWGMMLDGECLELTKPVLLIGATGFGLLPAARSHTKYQRFLYPTPTVQDAKHNGAESQRIRNKTRKFRSLNGMLGGAPNPTWIEWLMMWPIGHTDLKPLAMDKFQQWQQWLGEF